jgi:hypothetical protein
MLCFLALLYIPSFGFVFTPQSIDPEIVPNFIRICRCSRDKLVTDKRRDTGYLKVGGYIQYQIPS